MIYVIGTPGHEPRTYVQTTDEDVVKAQLIAANNEVYFTIDDLPRSSVVAGNIKRMVISDDGKSLADWVMPMDDVRDNLWGQAKSIRDYVMYSGCSTPLGRVDTDSTSQLKISGAVTAAIAAKATNATFSIDWTMADNSVVTHDADQMIAMGQAVIAFIATCQNVATQHRSDIMACQKIEDIEPLDFTTGYPADAGAVIEANAADQTNNSTT